MAEEKPTEQSVMFRSGDMPIYADEARSLTDVAAELEPQAWKPANVAAQKLFRCVECLRDLNELLEAAGRSKNKVKQRRKLKILLTHLHSLVGAIRDLANDLESNPNTTCRLPNGARELIPQIRSQLLEITPIGKNTLLSAARDKISAHIDKDISAEKMQVLLSQADPPQVGLWIHTCVCALADFNKLPVYFWSCKPNGEGSVRIMFNEPFVVTLGLDAEGKVNRLLDVHVTPKPPRQDVEKLWMRVVKNSKWMFGDNDPHITNFTQDKPGDSWAKSLPWLSQLSGSAAKENEASIVPKIDTKAGRYQLIPANVPFFVNESAQKITSHSNLL